MARCSRSPTGARSASTTVAARSGPLCRTPARCCRWSFPLTGPVAEYDDGGHGAVVGPEGRERDDGPAVGVSCASFSPDGKVIACGGPGYHRRLSDGADGHDLRRGAELPKEV